MNIKDVVKDNIEYLDKIGDPCNDFEKECDRYFSEIENFLATGCADFFGPPLSDKENAEPVDKCKRRGRAKKPVLADITETNVPLDTVEIKREKISNVHEVSGNTESSVVIKKEAEEMPAPTKLPPRRKKIKTENLELPKRATRSRTRNKDNDRVSTSSKKTSDVIIESVPVTTIELSDSEKETESEAEPEKTTAAVRVTRSKVRKQNEAQPAKSETSDQSDGKSERSTRTKRKKRVRSGSPEAPVVEAEKKKSRSNSGGEKANGTVETEYEDAVSSVEPAEGQINATYIASPKDSTANTVLCMNSTVVVENPKIVLNEVERAPTREDVSPKRTKGAVKPIFSPYENTPLKKKVEAFEKLAGAKKKAQKTKEPPEERSGKALTPLMARFQPKVCSTSRINKLHPNTSTCNESVLSARSASALKASQAEFRERERRRQEKEREALLKREALLQAQTEEKRRRREERQQRAQQQQRELLEREKQRQAEAQRVKEERHKQALAEREEKLQKQHEEAERRRVLAKKKAEQQREREEEMKRCAEKQAELAKQAHKEKLNAQQQQLPLYMTTKAPLLPTEDCYDSDDPEYERVRRVEPAWSRGPELEKQQMAMIVCGESIKNSFFCRHTHTPDLREIFENIDPRKLKRTSSAIWRKPPRYTLMPNLDRSTFSEESD